MTGGIFDETVGVALEDGPRWKEIRSRVQPDILKPGSAVQYIEQLDQAAGDFISHLRTSGVKSGRDDGSFVVDDFLRESKKFSFEAVGLASTSQRMGVLKPTQGKAGFIFVHTIFVQNGNGHLFLSSLPRLDKCHETP